MLKKLSPRQIKLAQELNAASLRFAISGDIGEFSGAFKAVGGNIVTTLASLLERGIVERLEHQAGDVIRFTYTVSLDKIG